MLRTLILLLYGAGLRLGEALALNLSDLDLEQSFLSVRQSKFYKSRLVPFGDDLTRVLRQYCRRGGRHHPTDPDRTLPSFVFAMAGVLTTRSSSEPSVACVSWPPYSARAVRGDSRVFTTCATRLPFTG